MDELLLVGNVPVEAGGAGSQLLGDPAHAQAFQPGLVQHLKCHGNNRLPGQRRTCPTSLGGIPPGRVWSTVGRAGFHRAILPFSRIQLEHRSSESNTV